MNKKTEADPFAEPKYEYHHGLARKKGWETKFTTIIWDMERVIMELREEVKRITYIDNSGLDNALMHLYDSIAEYLKYIEFY